MTGHSRHHGTPTAGGSSLRAGLRPTAVPGGLHVYADADQDTSLDLPGPVRGGISVVVVAESRYGPDRPGMGIQMIGERPGRLRRIGDWRVRSQMAVRPPSAATTAPVT
ncbi:hypothetical protein GCM10010517_45030 [Streptosporangium fragile]|uniref:Uncharacterized protein n=1 Tax=Streptosporangium fragile TaxID=46186 RepID=A0ABN3W0M1_9ACTN